MDAPGFDFERVSNPTAREILAAVKAIFDGRLFKSNLSLGMAPTREKLDELRRRLRTSGLAQALAGGEGALPLLYEHCHPLLRVFFFVSRPRSVKDQALSVANNLNFFLDPSKRPALPGSVLIAAGYGVFGLIMLAAKLGAFVSIPTSTVGLIAFAASAGGSFGLFLSLLVRGAVRLNENIYQAEVLYEYLLESYSDAPEPALSGAEEITRNVDKDSAEGTKQITNQARQSTRGR